MIYKVDGLLKDHDTSINSKVESGRVGTSRCICVIGLQLFYLLHFSMISNCLDGFRPPYDSTVELGWVMCHGLQAIIPSMTALATNEEK